MQSCDHAIVGSIPGNIIGSGIFISPKGVLEHSGSVGIALVVWVLGGGVAALGSLCYAELGVTIPKSGGDYSYVTEIFGGLMGFLLLWSAVLIMYPTTLAVIALTFSNYVLQPVFPYCIPPFIATRMLSAICILFLTWVNCYSVRLATRIQDAFTVGKLLALGLIITVGLVQICGGNYESLTPQVAFTFNKAPSIGQIALAFLHASFAFSGWNFLNYVTEEGDRSLEEHLEEFLDLADQTTFLDDCLCTFLCIGLNTTTRAQLSGEAPRGSFATFVEWVLVSCGSSFTANDITSPTPNPVPRQNPSVGIKQFEPTADDESFSAASC
ncbi:Asc-type amino acid transporter 1 [Anabarilius grahami]|uniref:Asc-type amino acid transporter 1 n=1 Tax=Anabarilius grahami TaxID=495550 RepID=A0A3N0ZAA0_ANAGA|nr:Asc-type amino acid transporter 1 [Anabarilius grahami]